MSLVIIVAVGIALLLIGMWANKEYHKRKRAEFAEDAQALGLEFFTDPPQKDRQISAYLVKSLRRKGAF